MKDHLTDEQWRHLAPEFTKKEFGPDPLKVSPALIHKLHRTRKLAGVPMIIHGTWAESGHAEKSYHYLGQACDFHFGGDLTVLNQFLILAAMGWRGIGYYPFWEHPGFHVDLRLAVPSLYWVRDRAGNYHYGLEAMNTLLAVGF